MSAIDLSKTLISEGEEERLFLLLLLLLKKIVIGLDGGKSFDHFLHFVAMFVFTRLLDLSIYFIFIIPLLLLSLIL